MTTGCRMPVRFRVQLSVQVYRSLPAANGGQEEVEFRAGAAYLNGRSRCTD